MRQVFGSFASSVASSAVQIDSVDRPYLLAATFSAREGNAGSLYLGDDSATSSANSMEFVAGKERHFSYEIASRPGSVAKSTFWVKAESSGDRMDYTWLVSD